GQLLGDLPGHDVGAAAGREADDGAYGPVREALLRRCCCASCEAGKTQKPQHEDTKARRETGMRNEKGTSCFHLCVLCLPIYRSATACSGFCMGYLRAFVSKVQALVLPTASRICSSAAGSSIVVRSPGLRPSASAAIERRSSFPERVLGSRDTKYTRAGR